jgi:hypothetical protein
MKGLISITTNLILHARQIEIYFNTELGSVTRQRNVNFGTTEL